MGIRPEDLHDEAAFLESMPESIIDANVEVTEMLGSETLLYLNSENVALTARVNPRTKAKAGDVIKLALDSNRMQLFDKDTEKVIFN